MCDQLTYYQNVCESGFETPTRFFPELNIVTDEAKRFYWLKISPANENVFARIEANVLEDRLFVRTKNIREVTIDLDYISKQLTFSGFDIAGDTELHLSIERGGKTLFETTVRESKTGMLPENLFEE